MNATELIRSIMFDVNNVDKSKRYRALYTEFHGICDFPYGPSFSLPPHATSTQYQCLIHPGSTTIQMRFFLNHFIVSTPSGQRLVDPRDIVEA